MGILQKAGGAVSSAGKGLVGKAGDFLSGTASNTGAGLGQFQAKPIDINEDAFGDAQSEGLQRKFANQLSEAKGRTGPQMSAAQVGNAAQATAAKIDQSQQGQFRNQQQQLANQLAAQAQGQGPSLAAGQLQQATNRNIAQGMAMAASQRGATAGQGLRQVAQQTAAANQQAAGQSAQLRMQEQMSAQQQLAGVAGAARDQDIGLATSQAGLQQQVGLANQDATNQFKLTQAGFNQQASANNQQSELTQRGMNDDMSKFYNQGIMGMEMADRDAAMGLETLKVNQNVGLSSANQAGYADASKRRGGFLGGLGEGMASMFASGGVVGGSGAKGYESVAKKFAMSLASGVGDEQEKEIGQKTFGRSVGKGIGKSMQPTKSPSGLDASTGATYGQAPMTASEGGRVPGEAEYPGDDLRNDKVQVLLSPGEIIVPRSIADDTKRTIAFIRALADEAKGKKASKATDDKKLAEALAKARRAG